MMRLFGARKGNTIVTPEERRRKTIERLKKMGIAYNEHLPYVEPADHVVLKSAKEAGKRALACMLSVQLACSIRNGENYGEALGFVVQKAGEWGLGKDDFLPKERLLIENRYTMEGNTDEFTPQDITDVVWTYEVYWSIIWALDLISDKELVRAWDICNTERAMAISPLIFSLWETLRLRDTEKILDMVDLFYCYHWACEEKQWVNPQTQTGKLNREVVYERRRGLEWLISPEKDWNQIRLDT